jgi:alpha-1,6-mannosyltransferase
MKKSTGTIVLIYTVLFLMAFVVVWLGYFTKRSNFQQVFFLFGILFLFYFLLNKINYSFSQVRLLIVFAIFIRLLLLFMWPNLSDDFYRFIWDGRLSVNGINPFSVLPSAVPLNYPNFMTSQNTFLLSEMNSRNYFSVYPPVLQFVYSLSAFLSPHNLTGSIVVLRLCIVLAEIGNIFILVALINKLNLPLKNVLLYALNPLVIMELSGNLHFEALMIFFVLLATFFVLENKILFSAVFFALAICTKLLPLIFLPLLPRQIGLKNSIRLCFLTAVFTLMMFWPFIDFKILTNIFSSVQLYFNRFEFNASVFYVVKWVGYTIVNYDIVETAGTLLAAIAFFFIFAIAILRRNAVDFILSMLLSLSIYFALSTVVHPWYVTGIAALGVLTKYRFAFLWSALVVLSYFSYRSIPYSESLFLVLVEYLILATFIAYEFYFKMRMRAEEFV